MNGPKILLALSGSKQSYFAAELCWNLAERLGSRITAHHVVDSHNAWEFIGHENPMFLDSTEYLKVYQKLVSSIFGLGEALASSYVAEAEKRGFASECIIDEGHPVATIARNALDYDLVVLGHRPDRLAHNSKSQFLRLSIAESLAIECPRPILVVQGPISWWTGLIIVISPDHVNEVFINSCLDLAKTLALPPTVVAVMGGDVEEAPRDFVQNLREANPRLKNVVIALSNSLNEIAIEADLCFPPDNSMVNSTIWKRPLMVIPTRMVAGERLTVVGTYPSVFVRNLNFPSILLWPEEYSLTFCQEKQKHAINT